MKRLGHFVFQSARRKNVWDDSRNVPLRDRRFRVGFATEGVIAGHEDREVRIEAR